MLKETSRNSPHVLVVEDQEVIQELLMTVFEHENIPLVCKAETVAEGIEAAGSGAGYDYPCDLHLPDGRGTDTDNPRTRFRRRGRSGCSAWRSLPEPSDPALISQASQRDGSRPVYPKSPTASMISSHGRRQVQPPAKRFPCSDNFMPAFTARGNCHLAGPTHRTAEANQFCRTHTLLSLTPLG